MANHEVTGYYTFETLADLLGKSKQSLRSQASRGNLVMDDFEQVVLFYLLHASAEFRAEAHLAMGPGGQKYVGSPAQKKLAAKRRAQQEARSKLREEEKIRLDEQRRRRKGKDDGPGKK